MKNIPRLLATTLLTTALLSAWAQPPQQNLRVELRQIEEASAGYAVSTQGPTPLMVPQQVQVRNGETATLKLGQTLPVQWVKSASTHNIALSASGASASSQGGSVAQELTWVQAGQSLSVHPTWPGAKERVRVAIELQSTTVDPRHGNEPAPRSQTELTTTVNAELGQWVTIATSGKSATPAIYATETAGDPARLIQIRVSLP